MNYHKVIDLVGKGNAAFLLKRSAKLVTSRKKPKEYPLSFRNFKVQKEEEKDNNDMN